MGKEILTFGDIEIEKNKFYRNKTSIFYKNVDIEKVLASNKISFVEKNYKYFIGYLYNDNRVKPLHIILPKTSAYLKNYDGQTKWMHFFTEVDGLLENYNTVWDEVSADIPVYNKEYLKTKINSHGDEVTNSYDKKILKVDSNHTYLAVISLDSALKKFENYCPQVFLKEYKYI